MTIFRRCSGLLAVLILGASMAVELVAQQKPAVVVSLANVKEQMADVRYVTQVAGAPQFAGLVEFMTAQYVQALDSDKPAGAALWLSDDGTPTVLGFVPVKDMQLLMTLIGQQLGPVQDVGNGVKQLPLPQPLFVKQVNAYAYVSDKAESLANLPQDPSIYLAGLHEKYNLAIACNIQAIPQPLKEMALGFLQQTYDTLSLQFESEAERQFQQQMAKMVVDQYRQMFADGDQLLIGLAIDAQSQSIYLDFTMTAVPNSPWAVQFVDTLQTKSDFSGFYQPNAAAAAVFSQRIPQAARQMWSQLSQSITSAVETAINADEDLGEQEKGQIQELAKQAISIFTSTIDAGICDGGLVVTLDGENPRFVAGGRVADGAAVAALFDKIAQLAEGEAEVAVEKNAASVDGFTFHRVTAPAPDDEYRTIFGEKMEIGVGVAANACLFTFGIGSIDLAKQVINASKQPATAPVNQFYVALTPILAYAAKMAELEDNETMHAARAALDRAQGKDRVVIASSSVPNGVQTRVSVEEGVISAIGAAVSTLVGQQQ